MLHEAGWWSVAASTGPDPGLPAVSCGRWFQRGMILDQLISESLSPLNFHILHY